MSSFYKKWEDLEIYDNYIFCKVMEDPKLCKEMLEILLGIDIEKIEYLVSERHIENEYSSHGVRLDIFVKNSDKIYNLEMQTGDYTHILNRARYYHSAMDIDETERGIDYKELKENYVLFICRGDPFGAKIPIYTKKTIFLETDAVLYDDKSHTVFYNASAYAKAENPEIRAVLKFISTLMADTEFTKELAHTVDRVKSNRNYRIRYMTVAQEIIWEKRAARKEGLAEGLAEGRAEGRAEGLTEGRVKGAEEHLLQLIKIKLSKNKSPEQIADEIELPLEETLAYIKQLS